MGHLVFVFVFVFMVVVWLVSELAIQFRQRSRSGRVRVQEYRTLLVFAALCLLGSFLASALARSLPGLGVHPKEAFDFAAVGVLAAGVVTRLWAIRTLGRYFRGTVHVQEGHQVIQSGPYRVVRHPAYSGLLLIFLGIALSFANLASFAVFMICATIALLQRIRVEERTLSTELGSAYTDYATGKPRLIPHVW